jgi:hypothetical protein
MPAGPHPLLPHLVDAIEARARRHRSVAARYSARRPAAKAIAQSGRSRGTTQHTHLGADG